MSDFTHIECRFNFGLIHNNDKIVLMVIDDDLAVVWIGCNSRCEGVVSWH